MVQSKNVRSTLFVAVFCLFLALLVWYWTETKIQFYLNGSKNKNEKIGQIKTVNYDTLINFSGQLVWQKIDVGDFLFDGNSLQTDRNSSTEIILDDGQQLTIGTNSLVRFIKEDGAISLQLVEGQIEIKNDSAVSDLVKENKTKLQFYLKTPNGKINTKSSHLKVEKKSKDQKDFKFEVVTGQPKMIDSEKPIVSEKIIVETKPKEIKKLLPPTITELAPNPILATPKPLPVETPPPAIEKPVAVEKPVEKPLPPVPQATRAPAEKPILKKKAAKLPEKIPLTAPKIKRVDVKVVE